ncbi:DNA primase large subunit-like [Babylonia areolata]|uniref:DNA primase large subunit-like n=1 Tax=Babylonia areolata TaxID=304850 RepID=UPI003FD35C59
MEFKSTATPRTAKIRRRGHVKVGDTGSYSHCVQIYKFPPTDTITLDEFEELAVERLKVLKAVETAGVRYAKGSENYNKLLEREIRETKLKNSVFEKGSLDDSLKQQNRWKDHVSHFILRLAYCRSEDLRRWFIQQEVDLFRFRFQQESPQSRAEFMVLNDLNYHPIDKEEHLQFRQQLNSACKDETYYTPSVQFYKVPFTEALDLVRGRRVFLHHGSAYVPQDDLVSILLTVYRVQLSYSLSVTARRLPHLEEDGRLLPMLCSLSRRYVGQDYGNKKPVGEMTADMIDMLSKKSFPLCMQQLHSAFRTNHHLRHGGRQQFGLFLKGIGLSLEEAIKFWRTEFTKIIDADQFDKKYLYNIRHNYGKEGKKTDYTPYSCMKIITSNAPATGDFHGCPFKHSDQDTLKQKLKSQGLKKEDVDQVLQYSKGGHYQVACAKMFELIHGSLTGGEEEVEVSFQHPNQYFEESYKRLHKNTDKPSSAPQTPRGVKIVPASSQSTPKNSQSGSSQAMSQATPPASGTTQSDVSASQDDGFKDMDDDFDLDEATLQQIDDAALQESQSQ